MTYTIEKVDNRLHKITLNYHDEDVDLVVERKVSGDEKDAQNYVVHFDRDARYNNARLFPTPEPEYSEEEMYEDYQ